MTFSADQVLALVIALLGFGVDANDQENTDIEPPALQRHSTEPGYDRLRSDPRQRALEFDRDMQALRDRSSTFPGIGSLDTERRDDASAPNQRHLGTVLAMPRSRPRVEAKLDRGVCHIEERKNWSKRMITAYLTAGHHALSGYYSFHVEGDDQGNGNRISITHAKPFQLDAGEQVKVGEQTIRGGVAKNLTVTLRVNGVRVPCAAKS